MAIVFIMIVFVVVLAKINNKINEYIRIKRDFFRKHKTVYRNVIEIQNFKRTLISPE